MVWSIPRAEESGSGAAAGSSNNFVAVDAAATGGYLGATAGTGVLRTGSWITKADGGNFVTLDVSFTVNANADTQVGPSFTNASSGGAAGSFIVLSTSGSGDSYLRWGVAAQTYAVGIDNSATNDPWGIWDGSSISGNAILSVNAVDRSVGINQPAAATVRLYVVGDSGDTGGVVRGALSGASEFTVALFENTSTDVAAGTRITIQTAGGGDSLFRYLLGTTRGWSLGVDNSNSDAFTLSTAASANPALGTSNVMTWSVDGLIAIGDGTTLASLAQLHVKQPSTTAAIAALRLSQNDTDQEFARFDGTETADAASSLSSLTVATINGYIRVNVNGTDRWIATYANPTA